MQIRRIMNRFVIDFAMYTLYMYIKDRKEILNHLHEDVGGLTESDLGSGSVREIFSNIIV